MSNAATTQATHSVEGLLNATAQVIEKSGYHGTDTGVQVTADGPYFLDSAMAVALDPSLSDLDDAAFKARLDGYFGSPRSQYPHMGLVQHALLWF